MGLLFRTLVTAILESFGLGGLAYAGFTVLAFALAIPCACSIFAAGFWYMEWNVIRDYPFLLVPILGYPAIVNGWRGWSVLKAISVGGFVTIGISWILGLIGNVAGMAVNTPIDFGAIAIMAFGAAFLGLLPVSFAFALSRRGVLAIVNLVQAKGSLPEQPQTGLTDGEESAIHYSSCWLVAIPVILLVLAFLCLALALLFQPELRGG